jgi:mannose-1-phosphate guanylyltransferase
MKAMILAAGLGTRLRPLTSDRPKALVEIARHTLLEITLRRLRAFGVRDVIVNTHHFADQIASYLHANGDFGMRIVLSREDTLLDTGGGLKNAASFFLDSPSDADEPFLLHNVDVLSTIDLARMLRQHAEHNALATLAVQSRPTTRPLLFDETGQLCGRIGPDGATEMARPDGDAQPLAFSGIHILSPRLLTLLEEDGAFPIIPAYLRLAARGQRILAFRADAYYWRDLGRTESLTQAAQDLARGLWSIA